MLYLVRKLNESIIINDNIEVKVVEIKGKSVKLGFEFPTSATVLRKEVHDRIVQENLAAQAQHDDEMTDAMAALGSAINVGKNTLKLDKDKKEQAADQEASSAGDNVDNV